MKIKLALTLLLIFYIAPLWASPHIQDFAKVVSPDLIQKLEPFLNEVQTKKGLYIQEIILPHFAGKEPNEVINSFIQQFNQEHANNKKRVLLIIVMENNFIKLDASPALSEIYTSKVIKDITGNITIKMQEKNYDEMARVGIAGIYHYYEKPPTSAKKVLFNLLILLGFTAVIFALIKFKPQKPKSET